MVTEESIMALIRANTESCPTDLNPDMNLKEEAGIDSFEMIMITNALEEEYGLTIRNEDVVRIRTVRDIVSTLNDALGKR